MHIYIATEDELSEAVARRLVGEVDPRLQVGPCMGRQGRDYLRKKLPDLTRLAASVPVLMLTDLDLVACPCALIESWCESARLPGTLLFRVVVREIETWLLADGQGFADFSGVPLNKMSAAPEKLDDPKRELLLLVSRYGKKPIKQELLPAEGVKARVGLGYNDALSGFVRTSWSPERAAENAGSLSRTRFRLGILANNFGTYSIIT
jgi:hypothetical protein